MATRDFHQPELQRLAQTRLPFSKLTDQTLREAGRNIKAKFALPDLMLQDFSKHPETLLDNTDAFWDAVLKNLLLACTNRPVVEYKISEAQKAVRTALSVVSRDQFTVRAYAFISYGKTAIVHFLQDSHALPEFYTISSYVSPILDYLNGAIPPQSKEPTDVQERVANVLRYGAEAVLGDRRVTREYVQTMLGIALDPELGPAATHQQTSLERFVTTEFGILSQTVAGKGSMHQAHYYDAVMDSFGFSGISTMLADAYRGTGESRTTIANDSRVSGLFTRVIRDTRTRFQANAIAYDARELNGNTYFAQLTQRYEGAVRFGGLFDRDFAADLLTEHEVYIQEAGRVRDEEQLEAYALGGLEAIFDNLFRLTDKADEESIDTDAAARMFTLLIGLVESEGPLSKILSEKEKHQRAGKRSKRWEAIIKRAVALFLQKDSLSRPEILRPAPGAHSARTERQRAVSRSKRITKLFGEYLSNASEEKSDSQQEFAQLMLTALHQGALATDLTTAENMELVMGPMRRIVVFATDRVPDKFRDEEPSTAFLYDLLAHLYLLDYGAMQQFINLFVQFGEIAKATTRHETRLANAEEAVQAALKGTIEAGPLTAIALAGAQYPREMMEEVHPIEVTDEARGLLLRTFSQKKIEWFARMLDVMGGSGEVHGFKPLNVDAKMLAKANLIPGWEADTSATEAFGTEMARASKALYKLMFADNGLIDSHHPMGAVIAILYGAATLRVEKGTDEATKTEWRTRYIRKLVQYLISYAERAERHEPPTDQERAVLIAFETLLQQWEMPQLEALLAEMTHQAAIHPILYTVLGPMFLKLTRRAKSMHVVNPALSKLVLSAEASAIEGYAAAWTGGQLSEHSILADAIAGSINELKGMSLAHAHRVIDARFSQQWESVLKDTALGGLLRTSAWIRSDLATADEQRAANKLILTALQTDLLRLTDRMVEHELLENPPENHQARSVMEQIRTQMNSEMERISELVRAEDAVDQMSQALPQLPDDLKEEVEAAYKSAKADALEAVSEFGWDELEKRIKGIEQEQITGASLDALKTIKQLGEVIREQSPIGREDAVAIKQAVGSAENTDANINRIIEILRLNAGQGFDTTAPILEALVGNNAPGVQFILQLLKRSGIDDLTTQQIAATTAVITDLAVILNQRGEVRTGYSHAEAELALNTIASLLATIETKKKLSNMRSVRRNAQADEARSQLEFAIDQRTQAILARQQARAQATQAYRRTLSQYGEQVTGIMEAVAAPYRHQAEALQDAINRQTVVQHLVDRMNNMLRTAKFGTIHAPNVEDFIKVAQDNILVAI